ncbi:MAG: F0F1 ATP synthase subunit alpha, partial [Rickettsia sp.]|nr:F0F1 ATP synthase subunit alpha [Rickettsia sp.]
MGSTQQLKAVELAEILKKEIANIEQLSDLREVGQVVTVGDGIARVYGIDNVEAGEVVEFASGVKGLALNLEKDSVSIVLIGSDREVKQGDAVKRTGKILQVPVGKSLLGRVVDGMANPIDGKGEIITDTYRNIEEKA